jgi:hypothetical protein
MSSPFAICDLQFAIGIQIANRQSQIGNLLSLLLLVLGVGADHAHDAFAADDLAVLTDSTNAGSDFHGLT